MMDRERWSWRFDFLASNIGFAACFHNMWRFPFLCYRNGGYLFLVPYLLCVMFIAIPILFMEMALGQYTSSGPIRSWKICPLFQGVGIASTVVLFWHNIFYNVILAYTLYYLYISCIGSELLWARCDHEWNTPTCLDYASEWVCVNGTYIAINHQDIPQDDLSSQTSFGPGWGNWPESSSNSDQCDYYPLTTSPASEFWRNKVLALSDGIDDIGGVVGHLALSLFLAWTLIYFILWIGVRWTAKVFYYNILFIHIILLVMMIRGVTLPGAIDGLTFYLRRDKWKLLEPQVWITAGREAIISFSIGIGAFTTLGSYNKFNYNFYRDSMIVSYLNVLTSIYGGVIVFSFIGFAAYSEGTSVNNVVSSGLGLFFEVFPHAFAHMPSSRVWSILFFLVVLKIGMNSQLVTVKAFTASLMDIFPARLRSGYYREFVVLAVCVVNFLIGIALVTEGGLNVLGLFDLYGAGTLPIIWICFYESIAIGWFYGFRRFSSNIAEMLNWKQIEWYLVGWIVTCPVLTLLLWIADIWYLVQSSYAYPPWANAIGALMALSSMLCINVAMVFVLVYYLFTGEGPIIKRLKMVVQPAITPIREGEEQTGMEMT